MLSTGSVLLIALLSLIAGGVIGGLLWRSFGPHQHHNRELEQRLRRAEHELHDYRAEVTEHFVETSRRVNDLTRNYKEVHEYLADSAVKLTSPSVGREMLAAAQIQLPANEQNGERHASDEAVPEATNEESFNGADQGTGDR